MEYIKKFEIVIVGAGPAGLRAAEILGNAGKKVLLLEKNEKIGPKVCAGGLTRKSKKYLNLPQGLIEKSFSLIIFHSSHSKTEIKLGEDFFFLVDREKLGQWQLQKIDHQNVSVRTGSHVTKITPDFLELKNGKKIGYEYLIGADGSASIVRRFLNLSTKLCGIGIQYITKNDQYNNLEVHFDSELFKCWYAWIFPRNGYASIGYGHPSATIDPKKIDPLKMKKNFEFWAQKNKMDFSNSVLESFPISCDFQGFKFGKIYLSGDAAGLASGFTGEGIYQALVSGEEVARMILDKNYKPHLIKEALRERNWHHALLRIVYFSGPFRNLIFDLVALGVRSRFLGRTLVRILS